MPITIQNSTFNTTRVVFLGLLSAFGPFVMDMYLAGFPEIVAYYRSVPSMVQMSLASCTIGLAVGQLVFGALSDWAGRKPPLMFSLIVYLLMSLACVYAPSVGVFIAARFFQGLAASGGVVISRSIAADTYIGGTLATMYGIIGMINGVATVLAPMFGGFVVELFGWHGVFWLLCVIGMAMLTMGVWFEESLPPQRRIPLDLRAMLAGLRELLHSRIYVGSVLQYGLFMGLIFLNLASGPFILSRFGLDASEISITFGVNSVALAVASLFAPRFGTMLAVMRMANIGAMCTSLLLACSLLFGVGFWAYEVAVFILYLFVGAMLTAVATVSMDAARLHSGIGSAVYGAMGYVVGSVVSPLTGLADISLSASIAFVAVSAAALALMLPVRQRA